MTCDCCGETVDAVEKQWRWLLSLEAAPTVNDETLRFCPTCHGLLREGLRMAFDLALERAQRMRAEQKMPREAGAP